VTRIENGADAKQSTMDRVQQALEAAGIDFIDENGGGPGLCCVGNQALQRLQTRDVLSG
jgi:hypothetical protein